MYCAVGEQVGWTMYGATRTSDEEAIVRMRDRFEGK
jgi:hypothetical protein